MIYEKGLVHRQSFEGPEQIGWSPGVISTGGKSELHRAGWSLTATGGDPKESATEKIPPLRRRGKGEKAR